MPDCSLGFGDSRVDGILVFTSEICISCSQIYDMKLLGCGAGFLGPWFQGLGVEISRPSLMPYRTLCPMTSLKIALMTDAGSDTFRVVTNL